MKEKRVHDELGLHEARSIQLRPLLRYEFIK